MSVDTYAGIDPARKRCCAVGEVDAENVLEALQQGLIVVPVSIETARNIWGKESVEIYSIAQGGNIEPELAEGLNQEQTERVRKIVQDIATDEGISFDEAFAITMGHLKYWADEMPKGKTFSGGGSHQAGSSQEEHRTRNV